MTQPTYVVIGNPIAHSKSPQIHALFAAQFKNNSRLNGFLYQTREAPIDDFVGNIQDFFLKGGRGCNITVPFKERAYQWASDQYGEISLAAGIAQAANTLRWDEVHQRVYADNTDGRGLVRDIVELNNITLANKRILLLGAGGAAAGVLYPLLRPDLVFNEGKWQPVGTKPDPHHGSPSLLIIANRTLDRAEKLKFQMDARIIAENIDCSLRACEFNELEGQSFDVVINATSASLSGERLPIANTVFAPNALAYDMMYGKAETPFLAQAREAGVELRVDGLGMLVGQAAEAFELWTGLRPDVAPVLQWMREQL